MHGIGGSYGEQNRMAMVYGYLDGYLRRALGCDGYCVLAANNRLKLTDRLKWPEP
jgi:hypothetical protein